jgi:hypothetical protein
VHYSTLPRGSVAGTRAVLPHPGHPSPMLSLGIANASAYVHARWHASAKYAKQSIVRSLLDRQRSSSALRSLTATLGAQPGHSWTVAHHQPSWRFWSASNSGRDAEGGPIHPGHPRRCFRWVAMPTPVRCKAQALVRSGTTPTSEPTKHSAQPCGPSTILLGSWTAAHGPSFLTSG